MIEAMTEAVNSITLSNNIFTANVDGLVEMCKHPGHEKAEGQLRSYAMGGINKDSAFEYREGTFRFSHTRADALVKGFDGSDKHKAELLTLSLHFLKRNNFDQKVEANDATKAKNEIAAASRKAKAEETRRNEIAAAIKLDRDLRANEQKGAGVNSTGNAELDELHELLNNIDPAMFGIVRSTLTGAQMKKAA